MSNKIKIIDFHSHVLPCADHGSDSIETSIWQIDLAISHGVNIVIATPHFYPHSHTVEGFLKRRDESFKQLKKRLPRGIKVIVGAEVFVCPGIENLPQLDRLFVKDTKTLLLELPFDSFEECYCDSVKAMVDKGINVVLAHADRYPTVTVEKMLRSGALIQINASALADIGRRKEVLSWVKRGVVVAIGSDIHGRDKKAYKKFVKAIKLLKNNSEDIFEKSYFLTKKA